LESERIEATRMEADYSSAYAEFSSVHAQQAPLVEALKRVEEEKAGLSQKLEALKGMVAQLEAFDPDWEEREKGECEALRKEITEMTGKVESLRVVAAAVERRRDELAAHVADLKQAAEEAGASVDDLEAKTAEVDAKVSISPRKEGFQIGKSFKLLRYLYLCAIREHRQPFSTACQPLMHTCTEDTVNLYIEKMLLFFFSLL
jgi:chromosome segregation ATPase